MDHSDRKYSSQHRNRQRNRGKQYRPRAYLLDSDHRRPSDVRGKWYSRGRPGRHNHTNPPSHLQQIAGLPVLRATNHRAQDPFQQAHTIDIAKK